MSANYTPIFPGPIQGWFVNYSRANYWKVKRTLPWEDLEQEAYVVFLRCKRKYPELDTPQHFMSLFQRAWINHFTDLANRDTQDRVVVSQIGESSDGSEISFESVGEVDNDGMLAIMIKEAPREISMVLNLFLNAPTELAEVALASWRGKDKRCTAGGSKRICQLLGLPLDYDVMGKVEEYFTTK